MGIYIGSTLLRCLVSHVSRHMAGQRIAQPVAGVGMDAPVLNWWHWMHVICRHRQRKHLNNYFKWSTKMMMSGTKVDIRIKKLKHLNASKVDMSVKKFADMEADSRASNSK